MRNLSLTFLLLTSVVIEPAAARVWRDISGKYEIEAELVKDNGETVQLEKADGKVISVQVAHLSQADQAYLKRLHSRAAAEAAGARLGEALETRLTIGIWITGQQGTVNGLTSAIAIPAVWPEQEFKVLATDKTPQVRKITYRNHPGGSRQMVIQVPHLSGGETAKATITFLLRRRPIMPPTDTSIYRLPKSPPREVRTFLLGTPGIDVRNTRIRKIAEQLAEGDPGGWELAQKTFKWVTENLEYTAGDLKGAVWAAQHGKGDCEEYTSLFIALCRANGIPARAVWVPGHCYAEFYLEDDLGQGHWFPCDGVAKLFGQVPATQPILQKGDSFHVPELKDKGPQRYLGQTLTGKIGQGAAQPDLGTILELR
ncbi:MAG: transglutaminase domain-containing protein [Pirellulales bacterium]